MPNEEQPIFVVSAPRSGSTLLRLILDAHPRIAVPPPSWLYELIRPYLYSYGDFGQADNFRELCEDALETPTIKRWKTGLDPEQLAGLCRERSFAGVFEALHRHYAERGGKSRWGEKSPRDSFWIDEIKSEFPTTRFVHIVRDGRDMAIDIAESSLRPYSVYMGAHYWKYFVSAIRESISRLAPDDIYQIRYEDLCAEPEGSLKKLCAFLREDFDEAMLRHHMSSDTKGWSADPLHAKTARPITTDYCGMYKHRLPAADAQALEAVFADLLEAYGYPTSGGRPLDARLSSQLYQSDLASSAENYQWKAWHVERRNKRRERGVYSTKDRESLLWSLQ